MIESQIWVKCVAAHCTAALNKFTLIVFRESLMNYMVLRSPNPLFVAYYNVMCNADKLINDSTNKLNKMLRFYREIIAIFKVFGIHPLLLLENVDPITDYY